MQLRGIIGKCILLIVKDPGSGYPQSPESYRGIEWQQVKGSEPLRDGIDILYNFSWLSVEISVAFLHSDPDKMPKLLHRERLYTTL